MDIRRFGPDHGRLVPRPGCVGLRATVIQLPAHVLARSSAEELADRYAGLPIVLEQPTAVIYLSFDERAEMDEHDAPIPILFLVIGGRGFVRVGGPQAETQAVQAGDAILWPPKVLHKAWTAGETMQAIVIEYVGAG